MNKRRGRRDERMKIYEGFSKNSVAFPTQKGNQPIDRVAQLKRNALWPRPAAVQTAPIAKSHYP